MTNSIFVTIADGALAKIDRASRWCIVACMAAMIAVVSIQVVLRYGLAASMDWAEEVSRLSFVWAVFLAIPHGVPRAAHVGINVLTARLPETWRSVLTRLNSLAGAGLLGLAAWAAADVAFETWDQMLSTLDLSSGWFYAAVSTGSAHAALHFLRQAWKAPRAETALQGVPA